MAISLSFNGALNIIIYLITYLIYDANWDYPQFPQWLKPLFSVTKKIGALLAVIKGSCFFEMSVIIR